LLIPLQVNEGLRVAIAVATFVYAGIEDWRKRDISPWTWVPGIAIGVAFSVLEALHVYPRILVLLSSMVTVLVVCAFAIAVFVARAMGGADFLAIACLGSLLPYPLITLHGLLGRSMVPPILHVLLYSSLLSVAPIVANVIHNLGRRDVLDALGLPKWKKLRFFLTARVLTIEEFERKRFYYPLYVPGLVDRSSFDVEEDDRAWVEKLKSSGAQIVIATWGVPTVSLMCVAMLIYLALGVSPIDAALALAQGR